MTRVEAAPTAVVGPVDRDSESVLQRSRSEGPGYYLEAMRYHAHLTFFPDEMTRKQGKLTTITGYVTSLSIFKYMIFRHNP